MHPSNLTNHISSRKTSRWLQNVTIQTHPSSYPIVYPILSSSFLLCSTLALRFFPIRITLIVPSHSSPPLRHFLFRSSTHPAPPPLPWTGGHARVFLSLGWHKTPLQIATRVYVKSLKRRVKARNGQRRSIDVSRGSIGSIHSARTSVYERLSGLGGTCARLECSSRALVYFVRSLICDTGVALIAAEPRECD